MFRRASGSKARRRASQSTGAAVPTDQHTAAAMEPPLRPATLLFPSPKFDSPLPGIMSPAATNGFSSSAPDFKVYEELAEMLALSNNKMASRRSCGTASYSARVPNTREFFSVAMSPPPPPLPPRWAAPQWRLRSTTSGHLSMCEQPFPSAWQSERRVGDVAMRRASISYMSIADTSAFSAAAVASPPPPPLPPRLTRGEVLYPAGMQSMQLSAGPCQRRMRSPRIRMGSLSIRSVSMEVF